MHFFLGNRKLVKADEDGAAEGLEGLAAAVDSGMSADDVTKGLIASNNTPQAAGQLMAKLANNISDANVFVCSDSTGNSSEEWVYLYAQWLAEEYPTYGVDYYIWNDVSGGYNSVENIQVGTGTNTLSIYNGAVSGTKPAYLMGSKFDASIRDIPTCDLVIMNHGHNMVNSYNDTESYADKGRVPLFLESINKVLDRHTGAGLLMLTQNPRRDDDEYLLSYNAIIKVAGLINADIADSYSEFILNERDVSLYIDNIHPSSAGTQLYLAAVKAKHSSVSGKVAKSSEYTKNYLTGGDFSSLDVDNVPDGFVLSAEASSVEDSTLYGSLNGYSLALTLDSAVSTAYLRKTLTSTELNLLKGCWVTLSVKMHIPEGQDVTVGRPYIDTNIADTDVNYTQTADGQGGWVWRSVSTYIDPSVSFAFVGVLIDTGGSAGSTFNISDMVLSKGKLIGLQ